MRKFALAALSLFLTAGLLVAAQVTFVKYDAEAKKLTVKEGDDEKTYTVDDSTVFKAGDKEVKAAGALKRLEKLKEGKAKFDITVTDGKLTEVKFVAGKKKKDK